MKYKIVSINPDGSTEVSHKDTSDYVSIDISPEMWTSQGIEAGKCKDFSGKFMFPEHNKGLN